MRTDEQEHHGGTAAHLGADEQVRHAGRVLLQLRHPLLSHVLETGGVDHGEADEEDVGHGVGQRPEAVVVLLRTQETQQVSTWRRSSCLVSGCTGAKSTRTLSTHTEVKVRILAYKSENKMAAAVFIFSFSSFVISSEIKRCSISNSL